jgi:DNA-binding NarL/FixJ family response regulator
MSTEDRIHAGIDAATTIGGFIPGADVVADGVDILHSLQRKDWTGASIGAVAMALPVVSAPMLRKIKNAIPEIKVLMNTSRDNEDDILDSFAAGADGYITKGATSEQTISAIQAVSEGVGWLDPAIARVVLSNIRKNSQQESKSGGINYQKGKNLYGLTEREMEVLALLVEGLKNPQISKKLVITIATTKTHVHNILQKLYVKTRSKAVATAMKDGLV